MRRGPPPHHPVPPRPARARQPGSPLHPRSHPRPHGRQPRRPPRKLRPPREKSRRRRTLVELRPRLERSSLLRVSRGRVAASPQFSVLSSQFSVLSSQFSVLSSQFSVLSSWRAGARRTAAKRAPRTLLGAGRCRLHVLGTPDGAAVGPERECRTPPGPTPTAEPNPQRAKFA